MPRKQKSEPSNLDLDKALGILAERVEQNHTATIQRFDDGMALVLEKLKPIDDLKSTIAAQEKTLAEHGSQISFWRGSIAVLGALWLAAVSAAVTFGAAILKRGH